MSKRSRSKANIPIHRESLSCLLPCPPILPSLPSLYKCRARSTNRPCLCKTKPIFSRTKPMQPPMREGVTRIFRSAPPQKNKANQTHFQNGQYKHKCSKNKGLCQRTTNNEHYSKQTQSIQPNSPAPKSPPTRPAGRPQP